MFIIKKNKKLCILLCIIIILILIILCINKFFIIEKFENTINTINDFENNIENYKNPYIKNEKNNDLNS